MGFIKKVLRFFVENITTIFAIAGGVWVFFTYKKYETNELLNFIVSFLVLIAATLLVEKLVTLASIEKRLKVLESKFNQSSIFLNCRTSEFWHDAQNVAKSIFISGGSLHFIIEKSGEIETLLSKGCIIEAIPVKPYSSASATLYNNVIKEVPSIDSFNNNIIQTLSYLYNLKLKYPHQIVVRLNDNMPSLGLFAIYKDKLPLNIQVNLFSEKVSYDKRLSIRLTNNPNEHYFAFQYFCNQIIYLKNRLPECTADKLKQIIEAHT